MMTYEEERRRRERPIKIGDMLTCIYNVNAWESLERFGVGWPLVNLPADSTCVFLGRANFDVPVGRSKQRVYIVLINTLTTGCVTAYVSSDALVLA